MRAAPFRKEEMSSLILRHLLLLPLLAAPWTRAAEDPNATIGRNLAATCVSCHGTAGASSNGIPAIAGRSKDLLMARLTAFKESRRPATVMTQLAKGYSDAQLEAIAEYFAAKK
jgi:sulfide dehydrogenase cytochrome subunit